MPIAGVGICVSPTGEGREKHREGRIRSHNPAMSGNTHPNHQRGAARRLSEGKTRCIGYLYIYILILQQNFSNFESAHSLFMRWHM